MYGLYPSASNGVVDCEALETGIGMPETLFGAEVVLKTPELNAGCVSQEIRLPKTQQVERCSGKS